MAVEMKSIFVDTNIILDFFLKRENFDYAKTIIDYAKEQKEIECITTSMVTDIHYLLQKGDNSNKYNSFEAQDILSDLMKYIDVIQVTKEDIINALSLRWKDFEDALQYSTAVASGIECIVTNNTKDFKDADIKVMTPKEFLEIYPMG